MKVFVLSFFIFIPAAFAAVEINDPSDLLGTIDNYVNSYSFDSSYSVGDKAWYSNQECTFTRDEAGEYSVVCRPSVTFLQEVLEKKSSSVVINNLTITKTQFDQIHGNYLRYYFMDSFNSPETYSTSVQMEKVQFETVDVQGKTVQAIRAFYSINVCKMFDENEVCFLLPQEMLLGRNVPAVSQVLEHIYIRVPPVNIPITKILDFQRP